MEEETPTPIHDEEVGHSNSPAQLGMVAGIFLLGLVSGIPAALFGIDFFVENAVIMFGALFGVIIVVGLLAGLILSFRRPILRTVVKRGEVEMERFAGPLSQVAKFAAQQKVEEATEAARELGELMLARYAWVATRRWLVATLTALIAAIAALAGSALLFEQNNLLRGQAVRLAEQSELLSQQISLGEAQRSTSIVPEIIAIGASVGEETSNLENDGRSIPEFFDTELSRALRGRIIAATIAARPYQYLNSHLSNASQETLLAMALERRSDIPSIVKSIETATFAEEKLGHLGLKSGLIDRPVSPERGQLLSILLNAGVISTEFLTFRGADFSFSEVRNHSFGGISLKHAELRFADFSGIQVRYGQFGAAFLDQARFVRTTIANSIFSGIPNADVKPPFEQSESIQMWRTQLAGADFRGAIIMDSGFSNINALGANFDYAQINNVDFTDASLVAATFKNAVFGTNIFTNADLRSADFDGAFTLDPDFLINLRKAAAPETFVADRYTIERVDPTALYGHPNNNNLWQIDAFNAPDLVIWQVKRTGDFQ